MLALEQGYAAFIYNQSCAECFFYIHIENKSACFAVKLRVSSLNVYKSDHSSLCAAWKLSPDATSYRIVLESLKGSVCCGKHLQNQPHAEPSLCEKGGMTLFLINFFHNTLYNLYKKCFAKYCTKWEPKLHAVSSNSNLEHGFSEENHFP